MKPCILFRNSYEFSYADLFHESLLAEKYLPVYSFRTEIPPNSLVVGRYSCLPFYDELVKELNLKNSILVNSLSEHNYIADICQWYEDVKEFTPKTYTEWGHLTTGQWIVKGKTHSRKSHFNTHMYADSKESLIKVVRNLLDDPTISQNGLVVRDYIPLKRLDTGINGIPIVKEWRLFYYKTKLLTNGFYWGSMIEEDIGKIPKEGEEFANEVAKIISLKTNFFVLDIAEKEDGGYILIEINDGQQSGLSLCNPDELYANLKIELENEKFN